MDNDNQEEKIKLPLTVRPFYWLGEKSGAYKLLDRYGPSIGNFVDSHMTKITRIVEVAGTGVAGYSLGKLIYANTPEERGSALLTLITSGHIAFCASAVDLVQWQVKKSKERNSNLEDISSEV